MRPAAPPTLQPIAGRAKVIVAHPNRTRNTVPFIVFNGKSYEDYGLSYQDTVFAFDVPAGELSLCAAADGAGALTTGQVQAGKTYVFRLDVTPNLLTYGATLVPMKPGSSDWRSLRDDLATIRGARYIEAVRPGSTGPRLIGECTKHRSELSAKEQQRLTFSASDAVGG